MIYKWKAAAHVSADAQQAGEVCEKLERTVGLTASNLLEDSRPADAPLHGAFEWRDDVAAEKWRLEQAGQIIRCLVVTEEDQPTIEPTRAFFITDQPRYESVQVILSDTEKTNSLLESARKELAQFQRKYRMLSELKGVMEAADKVLKEAI